MIADLKPYPEYKESGQEWLGKVPAHWQVKRLKNWVAINRKSLGDDTPSDYVFDYLDIASVTTGRLASPPSRMRFVSAPSRARRVLQSGDTIVSTVRTYLKAVFTVGECSQPLVASTGFAVLSPRSGTIPLCLGYVAQSEAFTSQITAESFGIAYPAISETRLGNIPLTLPPSAEQAAIVRFLDHWNGRLEKAIRAKRQVIALLQEQKQAIIHRAVTRGLDPTVKLKDSGIPWLGDIPEHWEVRRLKHLASFQSGDGITSLQIEPQGDYPVYGGNGLRGYSNRYTHDGHFALIGRQGALCGNINYARGKFFASEHAVVTTLRLGYSVVWFGEMLKVMNLNQYSQSAAQPGLAVERIKNLAAPVPPDTEQSKLVVAFQEQTAPITTAIARFEREITLLREYRTRLTADVVTGKLDVRAAAAQLPEETEDESLPDPELPEEESETEDETEEFAE